ncbi:hypothetical protein [Allorhodopirellula solitaria]|uniref:PepSY domain-containing protein n=1 Tax=Allorhodopirellula solitaria TaxID=2527987 RepID=A0A5C5WZA9_9BACT|nr:hypothetical protein [Allorhodopirellula solitaria]TWT55968.1 hypothetical protein CA85_46760 [Allorhodopirellula solitaria]
MFKTTIICIMLTTMLFAPAHAATTNEDHVKLSPSDKAIVEMFAKTLNATAKERKGRDYKIQLYRGKKGWTVHYRFLPATIGDELFCKIEKDGSVTVKGGF